MENASKALLIAAGMLMAMSVLAIGVFLFAHYSRVGEEYEQVQITKEIEKFNNNFTRFENRTDITAQEIVTLYNFVQEYNTKNGASISITGGPTSSSKVIEFLKNNSVDGSGKIKTFKCEPIAEDNYDDETGLIKTIKFTPN